MEISVGTKVRLRRKAGVYEKGSIVTVSAVMPSVVAIEDGKAFTLRTDIEPVDSLPHRRLARIEALAGRLLASASGPARLEQLQRRVQLAQRLVAAG